MPSESDILSALTAYREHISTVNYRAMKAIIPQIEAADMEDLDLWSYPEEEEESRLEFVYGLFGLAGASDTNPPIKRASDILEHWDVLAPQLALDGAALHFDPAWRATQRKAYLAAVMEGLGRIECPTGKWELPQDWLFLIEHVDSLEGPGWYRLRDHCEMLIFWQGWGAFGSYIRAEGWMRRCVTGEKILELTAYEFEDKYEIAGGLESGQGNASVCYIMYSRLKEGENRDWSWRYVTTRGQFGVDVFENVVELLDWYKNRSQPRESDCYITAEEVFQA
ncbi:hypothetical protein GL218_04302 [Daldinia childiae]|uniref:uncharacterized protein n=1 Tax=Daldinia childiae TaxID=326645 RepID=UPI001448022D|nr:uncharacterized protein GL218_04302 [Daldinia childiae]KAF3061329.1 hypothetical protein GL218_04302 [Daldinia childiae]